MANQAADVFTSLNAFKACKDDAKKNNLGKGSGGRGSVKCPLCEKGTCHYSVAALNGHMHMRCDGCGVTIME